MKKRMTLSALLLGFSQLCPAGPDVKPGLWEITSQVEMSGIPVQVPSVTKTECITTQSLDPEQILNDQNCRFSKSDNGSNTVTWQMTCDQQGVTMTGTGVMSYSDTSFNGKFDMEMSGEAGPVTMSTSINGHYVGACQ